MEGRKKEDVPSIRKPNKLTNQIFFRQDRSKREGKEVLMRLRQKGGKLQTNF